MHTLDIQGSSVDGFDLACDEGMGGVAEQDLSWFALSLNARSDVGLHADGRVDLSASSTPVRRGSG